jgi:putative membrane protein
VLAHGGQGAAPGWDVATVALVAVALGAYLVGARRLARPAPRPLPAWRVLAFAGGLVAVAAAVSSPAEHLARELFAAHMVQHLVLAFLAAPLVALGRPVLVGAVLLGHRGARLTRPVRRLGVRLRTRPSGAVVAAAVHVVPWYVWHLPPAYELALASEVVHVVEHVTLLASGAALAWLALGRGESLGALAAVLVGMASMGFIAALLAFAGTSLYDGHDPSSWGLTALEDQQLGGALMWFPGSLPYLAAAAVLVVARLTRAPAARPSA